MANEERVRQNFISGTTTNNPLASNGTNLTSAELANVEAIDSAEHSVLVLDPTGAGNGPEIVYITAHTGGATSATIVRGREGSSGVAHASGTVWVLGPTEADFPGSVASISELPSTGGLPFAGQMKYDVAKHRWLYYDHSVSLWIPFGGVLPAARATRTSVQTITASTWTDIPMNGEDYDTDTMHDTGVNPERMTCVTAGRYGFTGGVEFVADNPVGARGVRLRRSDGTIFAFDVMDGGTNDVAASAGARGPSCAGECRLTAGQYVTLQALQTADSVLNLGNSFATIYGWLTADWRAP